MSGLVDKLTDASFIASVLTAVAVSATIVTIGLPLLERNEMKERMNSVALERDRIRARERERLNNQGKQGGKPTLRSSPGATAKEIVERFNLKKWLNSETATERLMRAGLRGPKAETTFLLARLLAPIGLMLLAIFYLILNGGFGLPIGARVGAVPLGERSHDRDGRARHEHGALRAVGRSHSRLVPLLSFTLRWTFRRGCALSGPG